MRNFIITTLITIVILCGIILFGTSYRLDTDDMLIPYNVAQSLLGDIDFVRNNEETSLEVFFSHEDFFYDETIYISITANEPNAKIYYTTDGSRPTSESKIYEEPLKLTAEENMKCTVVKAIAIDDSIGQSPVLSHSYFVGTDIRERFSTYIFSISSDPDGLYGYENGILVPGRIFDDFEANNPRAATMDQSAWDANYTGRGREWERIAYVEVLTKTGERVISQNAGLRVHGARSRAYPQKSLRLIARREYENEVGKFKYDFFKDNKRYDINERPIISYDKLVLRNDGNDFELGRLRTPLVSQIAWEAGYNIVSPSQAAAVFINGEYYGYADLNIRIDDRFLESIYGVSADFFEIVDGGSIWLGYEDDWDTINEFNQLVRYAENGFENKGEMEALHNFFDVDNLLFYYSIRTYIANTGWPRNNIKVWRYTGNIVDNNSVKELDGRFRNVLLDMDSSLGVNERNTADVKTIKQLMDSGNAPIFNGLLKHPEYAQKLANNICDMVSEHFSVQNVERIITELNQMNLREQKESLILHGRDFDEFLDHRRAVYEFIEQRPQYILEEIREIFGFTDMYGIISDGTVKINTLNGNEGTYFVECRVPVTPIIEEGQAFDHWLVNGEKRYDQNLMISIKDVNSDNLVYIILVTKEKALADLPPLVFQKTFDNGELFGFTMYNPTDIPQNTKGFYLSDDLGNLKRWAFPAKKIRPGNILEFVGRSVSSYDALLKIGLNFNPRHGEVIYLSDDKGEILDYIEMLP